MEEPEGYVYSDSRRNSVIFVDQSAQPGNPDYPTVAAVCVWLWFRGFKTQA